MLVTKPTKLQAADLELLSQQEEQGKPGEKSAVALLFDSGRFPREIPWSKDVNFQVVSRDSLEKMCVFGGFWGGQISPPVGGGIPFHLLKVKPPAASAKAQG